MHHHLYPVEDTYITNLSGYEDKNFGINEILRIGTYNKHVRSLQNTKDFTYIGVVWNNYCATSFTGFFSGSFSGNAISVDGVIASSASFTASYFSGSIDGAAIAEYSGGISGSISGSVTGSLSASFVPNFSGTMTGSSGRFTGTVTGIDTINEKWWDTTTTKFIDRTLIKFDITAISESIASGEITDPKFKLNLKVCNECELPITYAIYAFPVSQSWIMGNGYYSDGGSDTGASWYYRDYNPGTAWYSPITTSLRPVVDFLNNPANATASFAYGGGTWYYNSSSKQTFSYESSDISMDVTDIVMAWISGTLPNHGFILMSSDEIVNSGSGFSLTFYSKDTNSINSPYLDVMWSDYVWNVGQVGTSSVTIETESGIDAVAQTGSTFSINAGVDGTFSGNAIIFTNVYYITASNVAVTESVQQFTGSFTGSLTTNFSTVNGTVSGTVTLASATYFSGSIDGGPISESPIGPLTGNFLFGLMTGSLISASLDYFEGSLTAQMATITAFITDAYYLDTINYYASGIFLGNGLTGNIANLPVIGAYTGSLTILSQSITGPCGSVFNAQIISASFTDGVWSELMFSGYYVDGRFENVYFTGQWPATTIVGAHVVIPLPSGIDPYAYATVTSPFVWGTAFGTYNVTRSIEDTSSVALDSASFSGQFIDGPLVGGYLNLQLSGSIYTSSYTYTSSVEITSSTFTPLDTNRAFTVIIKDLKPTYKGGDLARIKVFGRREFPLKTFERTSQQSGYVVPELLPTSSYYAIKDNMSEEIIVDFDNYTRLSCEYPYGNFFILDTTGLAQERSYRILIRVENSGSKYTFDNGDVFKITR